MLNLDPLCEGLQWIASSDKFRKPERKGQLGPRYTHEKNKEIQFHLSKGLGIGPPMDFMCWMRPFEPEPERKRWLQSLWPCTCTQFFLVLDIDQPEQHAFLMEAKKQNQEVEFYLCKCYGEFVE